LKSVEYLDKYKEINFSTVLLYIAYLVIDKPISLGSLNYGYLRPRLQSKSEAQRVYELIKSWPRTIKPSQVTVATLARRVKSQSM